MLLQLAIRAASEVAEEQRLSFDRAIALRHRSNTIVHLYPTSVVARVATTTSAVRQGEAWLAREVAVARHLVDVGAPAIAPSPEIEPGPHQHLGLVLSFWEFVEELDEPIDPYAAGRALRICHEALENFQGDLPRLGGIEEAEQILSRLSAEAALPTSDIDMLYQVSQRSQRELSQLPMQPLHGDAHLRNVLNTKRGLLWGDWEDTFMGPIGWDLACLLASSRIFGTDIDKATAAFNGYNPSIKDEHLDLCIEARAFCVLVWAIIINQQQPLPERDEGIQTRLSWFGDRIIRNS
ncbi:aminoglycoside phosphotransferase family protein [Nostoc sp. UHCC 0302]|uniref:aminoglycoside phosphotransferase family protein n=1 Tax=Nostoc sp. UHCC 0302 TaxID=3134896 RepID=UPI00311CA326